MEINILNTSGKQTGSTVNLNDAVFNITPKDHAIYLSVKQYLANQRQGTHKTKTRAQVAGSTKKPWKQKGTGNARVGHKRNPLWRGGGIVFGPVPRDYSFSINKKVKELARKSALTYKLKENKIVVLDALQFASPKTKEFVKVLANLKVTTKTLVVTEKHDLNVYMSGRNLSNVNIREVKDLNAYEIMKADTMILVKDAVSYINTNFA